MPLTKFLATNEAVYPRHKRATNVMEKKIFSMHKDVVLEKNEPRVALN